MAPPTVVPTGWVQPVDDSMLFNQFNPYEGYGVPVFYTVYSMPTKQRPYTKSPARGSNLLSRRRGRGRGQGDRASSPEKSTPSRLGHTPARVPTPARAGQENVPPTTTSPGGRGNPARETTPFASQLEMVARHAATRHADEPSSAGTQRPGYNTLPAPTSRGRWRRPPPYDRNGLYGFGRGRRAAGIPFDETAPFPMPLAPPAARRGSPKEYVGYTIVENKESCGQVHVTGASEWAPHRCNGCD